MMRIQFLSCLYTMKKTLVIDNFDSFVFNLVQYIGELQGNPMVFRNNELTLEQAQELQPTHIVISPGPGHPADPNYFGICGEIIREMGKEIPLLGVCLGHQGITTAFGGAVVSAPTIMHGKTSQVTYEPKTSLFANIPNPFQVMRYHSLMAEQESFPESLTITAQTDDGIIMALQHKEYPIHGIQFHPESIGSPEGKQIIRNFLTM